MFLSSQRMDVAKMLLLLTALSLIAAITEARKCSATCSRLAEGQVVTVDCSSRNLDCIPSNFPDATVMDLSNNDIALLELEVPVSISDRVRPICLPPRNDSHLTEEGLSATVSGWGGTIPFGEVQSKPSWTKLRIPVEGPKAYPLLDCGKLCRICERIID